MFRTIAVIVAAIRFAQPQVAEDESRVIANALQEQALAHDFDPLTGVSIIHFESNFNAKVISKNGEDYGLGQIRARYIGACKSDPDPKDNPGPECRKVKAKLLDPEENIRVMAELITANRKFCKAKVGSSAFARWLASYQGRNNKRKKEWCKPGDGTHRVIRYRQTLLKELGKMKELKAELSITKPPAESAKKPEPKKQEETNSRARNREATAPTKDKSDAKERERPPSKEDPKKSERAPSKDASKARERAPSEDASKHKSEERKRRESSREKEKSKERR